MPGRFIVSGLLSASLCQKSEERIIDVVADWNNQFSDDNSIITEISINHYRKSREPSARYRVLLMIEPSVTWPRNHKKSFSDYDLVIAAAPRSQNILSRPWFNKPINPPSEITDPKLRERKFTLIAADKFSWVRGELYSMRRSFAARHSDLIEVFGDAWDKGFWHRIRTLLGELILVIRSGFFPGFSGFMNYLLQRVSALGVVKTKQEAYNRNAFALVIENSMELRTEKLYDAIEACTIPVYVGPEVDDGIPRSLYIQSDPNESAVIAAMERVLEVDIEKWKKTRETWMASPSYQQSDSQRFQQVLWEISSQFENAET